MEQSLPLPEAADVILERPVSHPREGLPIGNGRMGTLVWTSPGAVHFQINRVDVFATNKTAQGPKAGPTDYCGACARVTVRFGGTPFRDGPAFGQRLCLHPARCTVSGEGVTISCWVGADSDVLVVSITDRRDPPEALEVALEMWRPPLVRTGRHRAAYGFRQIPEGAAVVQAFTEAAHYCASAVAMRALRTAAAPTAPGEAGESPACDESAETARVLSLSACSRTRHILVASAASWEEQVDAGQTATDTLDAASVPGALPAMEASHQQWWHEFWSRTHVEVTSPDGRAQQAARDRCLFLYHLAATSRGAYPPKWNGSIFATQGDSRDWGSQFWIWTTEMLYWPLHAADAADLCEPFFEMYRRQLPAAATAARQRWDAGGVFFPETAPFDGPLELPQGLVPEYRRLHLEGQDNSSVSAQLAAHCQFEYHLAMALYPADKFPHGYSWISHITSSGAELAVHAWWRYRYTGDRAWLASHAYPLLRGVAEFYRSYCRRGGDGHWHICNTNAHEDFWGVTDSIWDLAAMRGALPLAIRAAGILNLDADLADHWRQFLAQLAPYPMGADPRARALTDGALDDHAWAAGYRGLVDGSRNSGDVQITPIFPFEDWTLQTREVGQDAVAQRTLDLAPRHRTVLDGAASNTVIRSPIAAVRAGRGKELPALLERYRAAFPTQPNGFSLFEGPEAPSVEHLGLLTMTLQEALLQSVSPHPGEPEIIHLFPAWPPGWDASFRLLARGGFLVSATMQDGQIGPVEIVSRLGEECRLRRPWPAPGELEILNGPDRAPATLCETDGVVRFQTRPGGRYRLRVRGRAAG